MTDVPVNFEPKILLFEFQFPMGIIFFLTDVPVNFEPKILLFEFQFPMGIIFFLTFESMDWTAR